MIYTNIVKKSDKTMFGKFSIQVAFSKTIADFTEDNITLTGDTTGIEYEFEIVNNSVVLLFKLPEDTIGEFTLTISGKVTDTSTNKLTDIDTISTSILYDTQKTIQLTYGTPTYKNNEIRLPITFPENIRLLNKNNFNINFSKGKGKVFIYGHDRTFTLALRHQRSSVGTITIDFVNPIIKSSGISVDVDVDTYTIEYPQE